MPPWPVERDGAIAVPQSPDNDASGMRYHDHSVGRLTRLEFGFGPLTRGP